MLNTIYCLTVCFSCSPHIVWRCGARRRLRPPPPATLFTFCPRLVTLSNNVRKCHTNLVTLSNNVRQCHKAIFTFLFALPYFSSFVCFPFTLPHFPVSHGRRTRRPRTLLNASPTLNRCRKYPMA